MSVAFRRDGDDEHLEPRFEIPIPPGPNRVTARGLALIAARVAELEGQVAGLHGAAQADETALAAARRDLRYWQTRQITAELVPPPDGRSVAFGTRVTFLHNGRQRSVALVGDDEADPPAGLLAWSAPLSRALAGAEPGERLPLGHQDDALEVLEIAVLPGG